MNHPAPKTPFDRVATCFGQKALMFVTLTPLLSIAYFIPQRFPIRPAREIGLGWIDRAIPFQPAWVVVYLFLYLWLPWAPLFATRRRDLTRYTLGAVRMFGLSIVLFFLVPIAYPRPALSADANFFYRTLVSIDHPTNSLPSLHAGLVVFTMLFAHRLYPDRRALLALGWLSGALILYATIATRQHYFVDLPAGALVAWASDRLAWSRLGLRETEGKPHVQQALVE
jgi:membrane-associated phospholipid phosphatase